MSHCWVFWVVICPMARLAEILLAMDQKRQGRKFFDLANEQYAMMKSAAKCKDAKTGEENAVNLFRMKRKQA